MTLPNDSQAYVSCRINVRTSRVPASDPAAVWAELPASAEGVVTYPDRVVDLTPNLDRNEPMLSIDAFDATDASTSWTVRLEDGAWQVVCVREGEGREARRVDHRMPQFDADGRDRGMVTRAVYWCQQPTAMTNANGQPADGGHTIGVWRPEVSRLAAWSKR